MTDRLWAGVEWTAVENVNSQTKVLAWSKTGVPYRQDANALQTLDVWIPAAQIGYERPSNDQKPGKGIWIIYIHGGAWRDPRITPQTFGATVNQYLAEYGSIGIAGFASLSYSLSPYPDNGTDPMPPSAPNLPRDPSRSAKHPDHIRDVLQAISFLDKVARLDTNYILVGHSCGATLALQVAMDHARWNAGPLEQTPKPKAIVGLNGLYDLPALVHEPGDKHKPVVPIYTAFLQGAFGDDEAAWRAVSPVAVQNWSDEWQGGQQVLLCQSLEDMLVPYSQTGTMLDCLSQNSGLKVTEGKIDGNHNDVWIKGTALAKLLENLVKQLAV